MQARADRKENATCARPLKSTRLAGSEAYWASRCRAAPASRLGSPARTTLGPRGRRPSSSSPAHTRMCLCMHTTGTFGLSLHSVWSSFPSSHQRCPVELLPATQCHAYNRNLKWEVLHAAMESGPKQAVKRVGRCRRAQVHTHLLHALARLHQSTWQHYQLLGCKQRLGTPPT